MRCLLGAKGGESMSKQPEALLIAAELLEPIPGFPEPTILEEAAAAELRRLHAVNAELLAALDLATIDCQHLHHAYKDRHILSEPCPVVARCRAAIANATKEQE